MAASTVAVVNLQAPNQISKEIFIFPFISIDINRFESHFGLQNQEINGEKYIKR